MSTADYTVTHDDILAILPHRPPFLFVDSVKKLQADTFINAQRALRPDEPHFAGHFPGQPIMPGVLVTDALAQAAGLLVGLSKKLRGGDDDEGTLVFYLAAVDMKYTNPAYPGETLSLTARAQRTFGAFHTFAVEAATKRKVIAKGTLTLAMMEGAL